MLTSAFGFGVDVALYDAFFPNESHHLQMLSLTQRSRLRGYYTGGLASMIEISQY